MKNTSLKKKQQLLRFILVVVTVVLICVLTVYIILSQNNKSNSYISAETNKKDVAESTDINISGRPEEISNKRTIKITELSVQLTNVPESLSDVTYRYNPGRNGLSYVSFYAPDIENECSDFEIGTLSRIEGKYDDNPNITLLKQFDDFWVATAHPQSACVTEEKQVAEKWSSRVSVLASLLNNADSIQTIK